KLIGPWFIKARLQKPNVATVEQKFPDECEKISDSASKVNRYFEGAGHSESFEKAVLELVGRLPPALGQRIKDLAGYTVGTKRVFSAIHSSDGDFPYYIKKDAAAPHRLGIESFVNELKRLPAEEPAFEIDRAAVAGKLMLYLWDNVFDRDKSPLAALLGIEPRLLRTFGQFTDQADAFIERVCARALPQSPVPGATGGFEGIAVLTTDSPAS
ncbi:MAG: hypothetical protein J0M19_14050, partial [Sphingomonadales bacterium]|nr:hypothetical protein [Sphingomonadales bacterium]